MPFPEVPEDNLQKESWNMATAYHKKIIEIVGVIMEIELNPYKNGQARYKELYNAIRIFEWLISPYLDEAEQAEADEKFMKYINSEPVVETGYGQIVPATTEDKMFEFPKWALKKLKQKGALVPPQFDPEEAGL